MIKRAFVNERPLVQRQVQRRILHVELGVPGSNLARLDAEHLSIKVNAPLDIAHVNSDVRLESVDDRRPGVFHKLHLYPVPTLSLRPDRRALPARSTKSISLSPAGCLQALQRLPTRC